jgi:Mg2+/Co2+ transporter CorB
MLVNILDLENVTVDDIMVPRNEFYGIDLDDDDDTILRRIRAARTRCSPCGAATATTSRACCTCAT